jgi:hypothetical protein
VSRFVVSRVSQADTLHLKQQRAAEGDTPLAIESQAELDAVQKSLAGPLQPAPTRTRSRTRRGALGALAIFAQDRQRGLSAAGRPSGRTVRRR